MTVVASASGATPAPVLGASAVIQRISGHVRFKPAGSRHFATLGSTPTKVAFGTAIAAPKGTVQITIASSAGAVSALFYSGQFAISQAASGIATLTLNGPLQKCPPSGATGTTGATTNAARQKPAPQQRSLWGNGGAGHFQTKGNYAAATVLGTVWLTTDSCFEPSCRVAEATKVSRTSSRALRRPSQATRPKRSPRPAVRPSLRSAARRHRRASAIPSRSARRGRL